MTMTLKEKLAKARKIERMEGELKNYLEAVANDRRFQEYHNSRIIKLIAEIEMERI